MKGVRIFHFADFHLGAPLPGLGRRGPERAREKWQSFFTMLDYIREEEIPLVLIAGDLFEGNSPRPEELQQMVEKMEEAGRAHFFLSPGNHDYYSIDSPYARLEWPGNVKIFQGGLEAFALPEWETVVYGAGFNRSYQSRGFLEEKDPRKLKVQGVEKGTDLSSWIHLAVLHGDLISAGGSSPYNPIRPDQFPEGFFDYVALGHVHKRSPILQAGRTAYAYSGAADGSGFDELGPEGAYEGEVSRGRVTLRFHPFSRRLFIRQSVDLSGIRSNREAREKILESIKQQGEDAGKNYYRLYLTGRLGAGFFPSIDGLQAELEGKAHYLELVEDWEEAVDLDSLKEEESLEGYFVRNMLAEKEKAEAAGEEDRERAAERARRAMKYGLALFDGRELSFEDQ